MKAPSLIEAKRQYEIQLNDLNYKIKDAEELMQIVRPFGYTNRMEMIKIKKENRSKKGIWTI